MTLFECTNYREWFKAWLKTKPNAGHGELSRVAQHLSVNSTLISQVLSGRRDFSLEQGYSLCRYFSFNTLETRYFMALLQIDRAGSTELRKYFEKELITVKRETGQIKNRVETDKEISDTEKSFLVSTWKPTALLVYAGKKNGVTLDDITASLNIDKEHARLITSKMVEMGLIQQSEGRFKTGFKRLHIAKGSSFLLRHYTNWRLKAIDQSEQISDDEVMYTSVSSIAAEDIPKIKEKALAWISEYAKTITNSPAQQVVCLNLDFFKVR